MTEIMTASQTITDGQIEATVTKLREALRKKRKKLEYGVVDEALNRRRGFGMMFFELFQTLNAEAVNDSIRLRIPVDRFYTMDVHQEIGDHLIEDIVDRFHWVLQEKRKELNSETVQQVLGIKNFGMVLLEPLQLLIEAVIGPIRHYDIPVNRRLFGKAALDATFRVQYTNKEVIATMPQGKGNNVEIIFVKIDRSSSDSEVDALLAKRGLIPADPHELAAFVARHQEFADGHSNGTHWKDANGKWCYIAFYRNRSFRTVNVNYRDDSEWWPGGPTGWWFAGRRK